MSNGKRKNNRYKKRTYSEGEVRHIIHQSRDEMVEQLMYLFINAMTDMFSPTEDQLVEYMQTVQRYNGYIESGLVDYKTAVKSIKDKTGVELKLTRW